MSPNEDTPPRRVRENAYVPPPAVASATRHRHHHNHIIGEMRAMVQLSREMAVVAANIRDIASQNMDIRELMAQIQGQGDFPNPPYAPQGHYQQEDEVQNCRATSSDYSQGRSPFEREQLQRNRRSGSVFDRISPAEPRLRQQQHHEPWTRLPLPPPSRMPQQLEERHENAPRATLPRNRRQRREEEARNRSRTSHQQLRYEADENDSDEQQRSCDLDDDDENMPFSRELRSA
ncbi:conglutin beta 1-like [Olea europaea var. sylvestris]|uniref:conglutin beta 1-like n=1 Tax=Olea europaea var. sylvestris TaxID=158386 RepID=UPI000C1CF426|nr:conglutin beta 1-like [Olea europaea var. sylvestris]